MTISHGLSLPGPDSESVMGLNVLHDFDLPVMTLHDATVKSNVAAMARYCKKEGVSLAPHAKTSMTPYITNLQLESGAWGLTVASIVQARHVFNMGVRRIILANVLVEELGVDWVAERFLGHARPETDFMCYVDCERGIEILESRLQSLDVKSRLGILIEVGYVGGRTGARSLSGAVALARKVSKSDVLELRGIAGFEGLLPSGKHSVPPGLDSYLGSIHEVVNACAAEALFEGRPVVSAGGSSFFDRVSELLGPQQFRFPVETILRSGCYATHDHGLYEATSPFNSRRKSEDGPRFLPALELIAAIWSRPEPELVIAGFGRRDVPTDDMMPTVVGIFDSADEVVPVHSFSVMAVNDQHAFVKVPADSRCEPGNLLSVGISHPCGAFDRWRAIQIVNSSHTVLGVSIPKL